MLKATRSIQIGTLSLLLGSGTSIAAPSSPARAGSTPSRRSPIPKSALVEPAGPYRVVLKFSDRVRARLGPDGDLRGAGGTDLSEVTELCDALGVALVPLFSLDSTTLRTLERRAARRSGRAQPDLSGMFELRGSQEHRVEAARALQALRQVEFVGLQSTAVAPPVDIQPPTPDLTELQSHGGEAFGVNVGAARDLGLDGAGVHISDVEYSWLLDHEEFDDGQIETEAGHTPTGQYRDHGSAVLGVLLAGDNGYGVTGISPGSTATVFPQLSIEGGSRAIDAIVSAASSSAPGDILLLEIQSNEGAPFEYYEAAWMATRVAADAGVIVIAAAGNGGHTLDQPFFSGYLARGDSGAIIVGAGEPESHAWADFSTYGSRVDVQGWGEDVFTTGYGDYAEYGGDERQRYTPAFSGTSSASAIVAGVAALVQQAARQSHGQSLNSEQMRTLLRNTGTPQPPQDNRIGPLPQLGLAIEIATLPTDQPPSITIETPGDTQVDTEQFVTPFVASASEDTSTVQLRIDGELQPTIDDRPPYEFEEVVFPMGSWEVVAVATDIWGNTTESDPVVLDVGVVPGAAESSTGAIETTGLSSGTGGTTTGDSTDSTDSTGSSDSSDPGASSTGLPSGSAGPDSTGTMSEPLGSETGSEGSRSNSDGGGGCAVGEDPRSGGRRLLGALSLLMLGAGRYRRPRARRNG